MSDWQNWFKNWCDVVCSKTIYTKKYFLKSMKHNHKIEESLIWLLHSCLLLEIPLFKLTKFSSGDVRFQWIWIIKPKQIMPPALIKII